MTFAATGPYVVAAVNHTGVQMRRNNRFRQWSATARPDGYPDAIDIRLVHEQAAAVRAVERGAADYAFGALSQAPAAQVDDVFTRYADRVYSNPLPSTIYMSLNIRTPPFDNVDARRALNYAVDRRAVAELEGGPQIAQPTCQILPPSFPGYRPYCPYTHDPNADGKWTAPDLDQARRLVARSRTYGMRVTLFDLGYDSETRYVEGVLHRLGYHVRLRRLSPDNASAYFLDPRHRAQILRMGWYADYPAAADFLQPFFSCAAFRTAESNFCDPAAQRLMARAQALQAERSPSEAAWARVDRRLVDAAAAVPLTNMKSADLVSRRVGNFQFSAYPIVRLDQLWVR
jgi:peptide/nickel transport system substrate-binding protein